MSKCYKSIDDGTIERWGGERENEKKNIQIKMLFLLSIRNVERHNNHTTLKKWMNAFRTLFLVNVCMYIVVIFLFYFIKTQLMTFILVCGACRLNGKSLICLWYVFFVQLFLSHLATSLPERYFKMRFPFWESYFVFIFSNRNC